MRQAIDKNRKFKAAGRPLVDIGASVLTGIRSSAVACARGGLASNTVMETIPLSVAEAKAMGSDFFRAGFLFEAPVVEDDRFVDALGIEWLWADGAPTPLTHPLAQADLAEIVRHVRPVWPDIMQVSKGLSDQEYLVADAPCQGLLDMCFGLRNSWQFMEDLTSNWRPASALLDWSLETILQAYEALLSSLPRQPDIVVYGDDYGFSSGMFISEVDFRNFIRPRLRRLVSYLRHLTSAQICFHSCGAIRPIIGDIVDLGVEIVNFDPYAKSMIMSDIRRDIPADIVFHGTTDLVALGRSIRSRNMASVGILACELAESAPVIAAPNDVVSSPVELADLALAVAFIQASSDQDFEDLRQLGPVRCILERGVEAALATKLILPAGNAEITLYKTGQDNLKDKENFQIFQG